MSRTIKSVAAAIGAAVLAAFASASAQDIAGPMLYSGGAMPGMDDDPAFTHVLIEQFEDRTSGSGHAFRYDGQGWYGTDTDKLWIKSEGLVTDSRRFEDGQHEILYDRAISTFFDLQGGVRLDIDDGPTRAWGAIGVQGILPYFFEVEATAYASDRGVAARLKGSYDLLITQRLILQPQVELNFYSASDRARGTGYALSDIDAGLRLRYEITRKFAPYIGVTYQGRSGQAARFAQQDRESTGAVRFAFGVRAWF
jgi:copper resistance protein B